MKKVLASFLLIQGLWTLGCNDSSFSGAAPAALPPPSPTPTPTPTPAPTPSPAECNPDADHLKINFPGKIANCINTKRLWNFEIEDCSNIQTRPESDYTWMKLKTAVEALGMSTNSIQDAIDQNAKIIGWGETDGGNFIIAQIWYPPTHELDKASCSFSSNMKLLTACWSLKTAGDSADSGTSSGKSKCFK